MRTSARKEHISILARFSDLRLDVTDFNAYEEGRRVSSSPEG